MATTNKGLEQPALNATNWNTPLNANFGYLDAALGGATSKNVTGIGTTPVVLTLTEYQALVLNFTGTLTANVTYQIPSGVGGQWIVYNGTTGAFTLTIDNVAVGASVAIPQGARRVVYSDGTNIYPADNSISSVGTSGNVAYSNGIGLTGSSGLSYDGTKLTISATTATTNADVEVARFDSQSSGTPAVGFGVNATFAVETTPSVTKAGMQIGTVVTDITAGSEDFDFVLRLMTAGAAASEMLRVTSTGLMTLNGGNVVAGRTSTNTAAQSLAYAGITATADNDGSISTGDYVPTPVGGNFKLLTNTGAFNFKAPTAAGDYSLVVQLTNGTGAGAVTFPAVASGGFNRTAGDAIGTTVGDKYILYITKVNGLTSAVVQALQ